MHHQKKSTSGNNISRGFIPSIHSVPPEGKITSDVQFMLSMCRNVNPILTTSMEVKGPSHMSDQLRAKLGYNELSHALKSINFLCIADMVSRGLAES